MDENGTTKGPVATEALKLPDGRTIVMQTPGGANYWLAQEIVGQNFTLLPLCEMLLCVLSLNGQPEPRARTRAMMMGLADRIGRAGIDLLNDWYQSKVFPEATAALAELGADARPEEIAARVAELRKERLKNSLQTQ